MPNVVKGSRQDKMMVVPYRPWQRLFRLFGSISLVSLSTLGGFAFGYYQIYKRDASFQIGLEEQSAVVERLSVENSELRRQVTILERSGVLDQKINESGEQTISRLRNQLATLEQDLTYYRNVVSKQADDTGLMISEWDLKRINQSSRYRYKLAVRQQDADGDTYLNGYVDVSVTGHQDGQTVIYSLNEISEEQEQDEIKLRFKFFQYIEGELMLPENFMPDYVRIVATEIAPVSKTIDREYPWLNTKH
ncbi:MAG: hypothetical protein CMQ30_06770 [Gammaproteobacteria bacterium]|nr:hypothetical protein [Gammaproteobacteria bacterium]